MLSHKCALPKLPIMAALSAAHLPAIRFSIQLRRLYIARDADRAGTRRGVAEWTRSRQRNRAVDPVAANRRLQWRPPRARDRGSASRASLTTCPRGRRPLLDRRQLTTGGVTISRRRRHEVGRSVASLRLEEPRPWPSLRGDGCGGWPGPAMAAADYFPSRRRRSTSRGKIVGFRHLPLALRPSANASGADPGRPPPCVAGGPRWARPRLTG
jgi:hypothetical protein